MQVLKKVISKDAMKRCNSLILIWASLSLCALSINCVAQTQRIDTSLQIIKQGVVKVICYNGDTIANDTLTIEQYINNLPNDDRKRNHDLRQLNEQMKKPE